MNTIKENYQKIKQALPEKVTLVAVSKTKPIPLLQELYDLGERVFGENRVEELIVKNETLPKDIQWHMIGHLQSKKVKKIASFISLIHSVDSFKLLKEINKEAQKNNRIIDCLFQFHIAKEETKYGFSLTKVKIIINSNEFKGLKNIQIKGVMGMATFTNNQEIVRQEFQTLHEISTEIKIVLPFATIISMGMSGDYKLAIQEGSNMVRVGSSIFGSRN